MAGLVVYVTEPSVVCARVLALLDRRGYEYRKVQVTTDEDRAHMFRETGMMRCPLVVASGAIIGGLEETDRADKSGQLRELLAAAGDSAPDPSRLCGASPCRGSGSIRAAHS